MAQVFFRDAAHKTRLLNVMQAIDKIWKEEGKLDPSYGAAIYILTNDEGTWQQTAKYIDPESIDFEGMLEREHFGGAYTTLIELAANLFNCITPSSPVEFATRLDDWNFAIALSAIKIRRSGLHINDLKGE